MGEVSGDMSRVDKVDPERVLESLQDSWAIRRRPSVGGTDRPGCCLYVGVVYVVEERCQARS